MAAILAIANADILKLCRLDPADATADADATETKNRQQEALEREIKSSALGDATLTALLLRNVAKLLAAELLAMRRRKEGASGVFSGAGLTLSAPPNLAEELRQEAWAALEPYRSRRVGAHVVASGAEASVAITNDAVQGDLFGIGELRRHSFF